MYCGIEFLPQIETGYSNRDEALLLATGLIVGLTFLTPVLSIVLGVPALIFVVAIGGIYGILVILVRRLLAGSIIGLVVTSPFAANVPLASHEYLTSFPGHFGPQLWLVQLPLVLSAVLVLATGPRKLLDGATRAEGIFAAFVGWSVLAAVFGTTARFDTALYFSLFMAQALVTFALLRYTVQQRILAFRTVLQVFVGTVFAQSLFAVLQFVNGTSFGLTTLGEGENKLLSTLSLGPFGTFSTGTHVAGFTGMSFNLASLIILIVPITVIMAVHAKRAERAGLLIAAFVMMGVLRASASDAARGGLIVTLLLLGVLYLYASRNAIRERISKTDTRPLLTVEAYVEKMVSAIVTTVVSLVVLFYPSSAFGRSSITTGSAHTNSADPGSAAGASQGAAIRKTIDSLSIPYFDLTSLGIRLQQYIGGLDLFFKHPLFGIGGANFTYFSTQYGLSQSYPIHNIHISVLSGTGLPGFLLYIAALVSILWNVGKLCTDIGEYGLLSVGIFCGIVGYLSFGFWDILPLIKLSSLIPFWMLAGAVLGEYTRISRTKRSPGKGS
ncbi:O-antigen ligase family protein [Natrinema gari]|uniref:Polysaccharide deacetylase n=1 Tax=Natrinema gari JCM 14663 TaxID=1230459 RepID=L9ZD16_9EURY|nr:O-antigen ligase family protein [Natrinema gari]ELY84390.1 polysaccharide deacetylase [Natrinema gari JCM 14663]